MNWLDLGREVFPGMIAATTVLAVCGGLTAADSIRSVGSAPGSGQASAVVVNSMPLWHTCQILPLDDQGGLVGANDPAAQVKQVFQNLNRLMSMGAGSSTENDSRPVVKLNAYVRDAAVNELVRKECAKQFRGAVQPAVSVVVTSLPVPGAVVAIDAIAADPAGVGPVKAAGQASQFGGMGATAAALKLPAGPRVHVAGQAEKGDGSLADATRQTMASLMKTLKFLELEPSHTIQLKAFLTPMAEAETVFKEVASMPEFAGKTVPPVICVEWKSTLPIEIELIAAAPNVEPSSGKDSVEYLTPPGMTASPVYARVTRARHPSAIYVAGVFSEMVPPDGGHEVRSVFSQLDHILKESGSDFLHLVKATYYVATDDVSNQLNKLRPEYYQPDRPPSASKAVVSAVGIPERQLILDMIAVPK